jgi:hypothetical protein
MYLAIMKNTQRRRAVQLLTRLNSLNRNPESRKLVAELKALLGPMPDLGPILSQIPGESIKAKSAAIGITRQGWHNLMKGTVRPQEATVQRIAQATGLEERYVWRHCPP